MSPRQAWDAGLRPPALALLCGKGAMVCAGDPRGHAARGARCCRHAPSWPLAATPGRGPGHTTVCWPVQEADVTATSSLRAQARGGQATASQVPRPPDLSAARASRGRCGCPRVAEGRGRRAQSHAGPWREPTLPLGLLPARQAPFQAGSALEVASTSGHTRSSSSRPVQCLRSPGWSAAASGMTPPPGPRRSLLPRDMSRQGFV